MEDNSAFSTMSTSEDPGILSMLPHDPFVDSAIYDVGDTNPTNTLHLADWQVMIVELWHHNRQAPATETDKVLLHGLLRAPKDRVEALLRQLSENDRKNRALHARQDTKADAPHTSADLVHEPSDRFHGFDDLAKEHTSCFPLPEGHPASSNACNPTHDTLCGVPSSHVDDSNISHLTSHGFEKICDTSAPILPTQNTMGLVSAAIGANTDVTLDLFSQDASTEYTIGDRSQSQYATNIYAESYALGVSIHHVDAAQLRPATRNTAPIANRIRVSLTRSLMALITRFRASRLARGCASIRDCEKQEGNYECTIKCNRRFKSACDLFRHEETVFPQEFFFCFRCGDLDNAAERHLFTRADKMRSHNKIVHGYMGSVDEFKVPNVPVAFPEKCGLCLHERHRSWRARWKHVLWHYERGDTIPKYLPGSRRKNTEFEGSPRNDDDDDDDDDDNGDDDDNHDGNDGNNKDQPNNEDRPNGGSDNGGKPPTTYGDNTNENSDGKYGVDDFASFFDWDSSSLYGLKTSVFITAVPVQDIYRHIPSIPQLCTIQWKERVNQKGGTASVIKVELISEAKHLLVAHDCSLVVKQYGAQHGRLFHNELQAFAHLRYVPNIVRCFGSFVLHDRDGRPTYNLLLESAQCDLREYLTSTEPPRTADGIKSLWSQIGRVAGALQSIHKSDRYVGWHADVKPDNIFYASGKFTLGDFGLSKFLPQQSDAPVEAIMSGGTYKYSAPESYSFITTFTPVPVSRKCDIWSLGCVYLELICWFIGGFQLLHEFEEDLSKAHKFSSSTTPIAFHDGRQVHPMVRFWYTVLRMQIHEFDNLTGRILDLVEKHLLQADPALRYDSYELCDHLRRIFEQPGKDDGKDPAITKGRQDQFPNLDLVAGSRCMKTISSVLARHWGLDWMFGDTGLRFPIEEDPVIKEFVHVLRQPLAQQEEGTITPPHAAAGAGHGATLELLLDIIANFPAEVSRIGRELPVGGYSWSRSLSAMALAAVPQKTTLRYLREAALLDHRFCILLQDGLLEITFLDLLSISRTRTLTTTEVKPPVLSTRRSVLRRVNLLHGARNRKIRDRNPGAPLFVTVGGPSPGAGNSRKRRRISYGEARDVDSGESRC